MKLEEGFLQTFNELKEVLKHHFPCKSEAIALLDLTLLDEMASSESLTALAQNAQRYQVAAICVMPEHINKIKIAKEIKRATVINFPEGDKTTPQVLTSIEKIMLDVDEIDYVFPHQIYLEGDKQLALRQCQQAYALCKQKKIIFKVILETGALPSLEYIYNLSLAVLDQGCDFLKTSTGKIAQGASLSAAFSMLKAIADAQVNCGLKVSGGIRLPEQAFTYMALAKQMLRRRVDKSWFRIGASSLLHELVKT